jgi:tRNA(Ile)-lysidine synthase
VTGTPGLLRALLESLERAGVCPGDRVLVAVSGGRDSLVLLHALRFGLRTSVARDPRATRLALQIEAVHVDHRMRPGSSRDAAWLRGVAQGWEIPLHVLRLDPPPADETEARARRHEAFWRCAAEIQASAVLTAHHREDQIETILFRILRGTGLRGLAGIPESRPGPIPGILLLRPLLSVPPVDLDVWARRHALRPREDPTNQDPALTPRNRLRLELLPALEAAFPGARDALHALGEEARAREDAVEARASRTLESLVLKRSAHALVLDARRFLAEPGEDQAELLRELLRRQRIHPTKGAVEGALRVLGGDRPGAGADLGQGARITRSFDELVLEWGMVSAAPARFSVRIPGPDAEGSHPFPVLSSGGVRGDGGCGGEALIRWGPAFSGERGGDFGAGGMRRRGGENWTVSFPSGILKGPLVLRTRRPGDRVRLEASPPRGGAEGVPVRSLKKLLCERRVFRGDRDRLPLLVDAEGLVIWIPGVWRMRAPEALDEPDLWTLGVWDDRNWE